MTATHLALLAGIIYAGFLALFLCIRQTNKRATTAHEQFEGRIDRVQTQLDEMLGMTRNLAPTPIVIHVRDTTAGSTDNQQPQNESV